MIAEADVKASNPKDAVGIRKAPMSTIPAGVIMELGLAMLEGARKYGRHNYRVIGVRASVYYDAAHRHLMAYWEGEDNDPDSGLSHLIKAIASLTVLRDAEMHNKVVDDRPPPTHSAWLHSLNDQAGKIIDRIPDAKAPYIDKNISIKEMMDKAIIEVDEALRADVFPSPAGEGPSGGID